MLLHPDFFVLCEAWQKRPANGGEYCDIYDGRIWDEFQTFDDKPFLSLPFNFALQLNTDWFQPFTHTQHSEGVIYMSIMNLPRSERFRQENTILKYVHIELALCFLVTNYVYPIKIDRLTYHSIAKVAPVLPEKSP